MTAEIIVLMATVHQHMQMEDRLERRGTPYRTVVKPRQLGTDCGMALSIRADDIPIVYEIARRENAVVFGVYIRENDTWAEWKENPV